MLERKVLENCFVTVSATNVYTTDSDNLLIAKFSGGDICDDNAYGLSNVSYISNGYVLSGITNIRDLKYHESWDWLMPIVNKIKITEHVSKSYKVIISNKKTIIKDCDGDLVCQYKGNNSLHNTYNCVIDFIKWFNIK